MLDDNAISFGPRDTWGHEGSALPYYASGGSTGTDAPSNVIDMGEGDSTDGPLPDPTPNDHLGGVAPASAGGPLKQAGTGGLINTAGGGPVGCGREELFFIKNRQIQEFLSGPFLFCSISSQ